MNVVAGHVGVEQLNHLEMLQIEAALRKEDTLAKVLFSVGQGRASLIRIWGDCQGIAALTITQHKSEKVLYVWLLGGRRILSALQKLWEILEQIALHHGCRVVAATPTPELAAVYKARMGFVDHELGIAKEVDNGRWWDQNS